MAKIKVCDNRGQAKKRAMINKHGKQTKNMRVGSTKLVPASSGQQRKHEKQEKELQRPKGQRKQEKTKMLRPSQCASSAYSHEHRLLLLGEGDFSFAAALALKWGEAPKLCATCLEEEAHAVQDEEVSDNIETVRAFGGRVIGRVDAAKLHLYANASCVPMPCKSGTPYLALELL